jgi:hypothetical protein
MVCGHRVSFGNRSVWGAGEVEATEFVDNPFGHGWHVRRPALHESLHDRRRTLGVRVRPRARVAGQAWMGDHWRIGFQGDAGTAIQAARSLTPPGDVRGLRALKAHTDVGSTDSSPPTGCWASPRRRTTTAQRWWRRSHTAGGTRRRSPGTSASWSSSPTPTGSGCRLHRSPPILDASVAHLDHTSGCGWVAVGDAAVSFDRSPPRGFSPRWSWAGEPAMP